MFLKKFFDIAPEGVPATTTEPAPVAEAAPEPKPFDIASLMAQHGVMNNSEQMVATPLDIKEKTEEPVSTATEPTPVAPTTEATIAETPVTSETPTPSKETPKEAEPIADATPAQPTWQEVLKQQQPETILKELGVNDSLVSLINDFPEGLDPKMVNFMKHWKENGNVDSYLKALSTDYTKMSSEDVMKHQLRRDYPKATDRQLEVLYKTKIEQAYRINSDDESEAEEGKLLLEAEADKYRDVLASEQQNYLLPKPSEPKPKAVENTAEVQRQKDFERYQSQINESSFTKNFLQSKQLSLGEGEDAFTYPIPNPKELTDILFDTNKWAQSFFEVKDDQYIPNVEKQIFVAAAVKDYKGLIKSLIQHGKNLGGKAAIKPLVNASEPEKGQPAASEAPVTDPVAAMAKFGRII
jgi:hypothetical protein